MKNGDARYFVTEERRCAQCHGTGQRENPLWSGRWPSLEHWAAHSQPGDTAPRLDDLAGQPMEIPCAGCEGRGTTRQPLDLESALRSLFPQLFDLLGQPNDW